MQRRIAAVTLPALLCELALPAVRVPVLTAKRSRKRAARDPGVEAPPFAVVLVEGGSCALPSMDPTQPHRRAQPGASSASASSAGPTNREEDDDHTLKPTARLAAVSDGARRFGVCEGQSIAEARALVANLAVRAVSRAEVLQALGRVAEVALGFGATVAIEAPDTVWVDVAGSAHLAGGEPALAIELASRVRALGHRVRVAISGGPRLAQAFARWGTRDATPLVVPPARTAALLARLPVVALPVDSERASWLVRLGVTTVGELRAIPRASAASRLGDGAGTVLDLCEGRDDEPLAPHTPPAVLVEEASWDEPLDGREPLLFVLRGLASRLSARLAGRGEAAQELDLVIQCDRSIAELRGAPDTLRLHFDLATPLWREEEIRRVVASRLDRTKLAAPSLGLRLEAPSITSAVARQLELSRVSGGVLAGSKGLEGLPVLLAELASDIGKERVGKLAVVDSHRPELCSVLVPALETKRAPRKASGMTIAPRAPLRILPSPVPVDAPLCEGAMLGIDRRLYSIKRVAFERRLDNVEWWTHPVARDYLRLWLESAEGGLEVLAYVDRHSGKRFVHAIAD